MAPAQGQKGEWMRMPICLIAYTYASHSENNTHANQACSDFRTIREGMWTVILLSDAADGTGSPGTFSALCSALRSVFEWAHGPQGSAECRVPLPLLVIWVNVTLLAFITYTSRDSSKQARLCNLSHTQTSCLTNDQNGANYTQLKP